MSAVTAALALLAVGTFALRSAGPLAFRRRTPPAWLSASVPAVLAGLIAVATVAGARDLVIDARLPAVILAAGAAARGWPFAAVVTVGVLTAALLRLAGLP